MFDDGRVVILIDIKGLEKQVRIFFGIFKSDSFGFSGYYIIRYTSRSTRKYMYNLVDPRQNDGQAQCHFSKRMYAHTSQPSLVDSVDLHRRLFLTRPFDDGTGRALSAQTCSIAP